MFQEIKKAKKILQEVGVKAFAKKCIDYIYYNVFVLPLVIFKVRSFKRNYNVDELINFAFKICKGAIKPLQVQDEILGLLKILDRIKPKTILEIGTAKGGALFLFSRVVSENAIIISMDLPGGGFGGGYSKSRIPLYKSFAMKSQQIYLLRADSHSQATLEKVKSILKGREIDFVFIDGDHTYGGVKKDFEMYNPLVKKDGIIAFHDICIHPPETGCEVSKFWTEIKTKYKYKEIVKSRDQNWAGIGLLFVN